MQDVFVVSGTERLCVGCSVKPKTFSSTVAPVPLSPDQHCIDRLGQLLGRYKEQAFIFGFSHHSKQGELQHKELSSLRPGRIINYLQITNGRQLTKTKGMYCTVL